jgi:hypothetical protein
LDVQAIQKRCGPQWRHGPLIAGGIEADDAWLFEGPGARMIVSYDVDSEPGVPWIHASFGYQLRERMPTYNDMKRMHQWVFGDGFSYQVFVPPEQHINIASNVLHLWGRHDGKPALPDFGKWGTI